MSLRDWLAIFSMLLLTFTGIYYGYRFIRLSNILLGLEWFILALSAFNFVIYWVTGFEPSFAVTMFCDAFSRSFGIPVIASLGLIKCINGYEPSRPVEVAIFVGGALAATFFRAYQPIQGILPPTYFVFGLAFFATLAVIAVNLCRENLVGHAVGVMAVQCVLFTVSMLDGMLLIPGEETNLVLNFIFISNFLWAVCFAQLFYAYRALDAIRNARARAGRFATSAG